MNAGEAARAAAREIGIHKIRSLLSFSAISVGAASLLYTLAQTRGLQEDVRRNLELMGPGSLTVSRKEHYKSRGLSRGLTLDDARAIRAALPNLYMVAPRARTWDARPAFEGRRIEDAQIIGVTPEWARRNWVYTLRGRFLDDRDVREAARVCLVVEPGGWVKKPFWASFYNRQNDFDKLAGRRDLLRRTLRLRGHDFLVIGALRLPPRDKDPRWEDWDNPSVVLPVTSFQRYLAVDDDDERSPDAIESIRIDTDDEKTLGAARHAVEQLLLQRHRGEADFDIKNDRADLEGAIAQQNQYALVGLVLGVVALVSGGIGILNVTLAAVYSRVKEIGVRRALGAERADILALFVAEAAFLGLAGGTAGVALGIVGIDTLAKAADRDVIELTWYHGAAMIALSTAVAAAFAAYPAYLASRLDPVEAMREEA